MSVDILPTISMPPLKRLRSSSPTLSESNITKCGEVFVTNSADKWSFYCSHCQLSTNDIGVFVCHIRLQHLPDQTTDQAPTQPSNRQITIASSRQNVAFITPPPVTSIPMENLLPSEIISAKDNESAEQIQSDIVKEEPTVSINQTNIDYEAICSKVAKIADMSSLAEPESNNETSTSAVINDKIPHVKNEALGDQEDILDQLNVKETNMEVFYINNVDNNDAVADADIILSTDEEVEDEEDDNEDDDDVNNDPDFTEDLIEELYTNLKCRFCSKIFENKTELENHLKTQHARNNGKKYPFHCDVCKKGFKSKNGLKGHSRLHTENNQKQCPICLSSHDYNYYVTHIMTHESETCYPCQVCGLIYDNPEKRLKHWHSHEKEYPFKCSYCYRRFKQERYQLKHLEIHKRVKCKFCEIEFYSKDRLRQRPPYVCENCNNKKDCARKLRRAQSYEKVNPPEGKSMEDQIKPSCSKALYDKINKELELENEEFIIDDTINNTNTLKNSKESEPKPLPFESVTFCDSDRENIENDDEEEEEGDSDESSDSDVEFVNVLHDPDAPEQRHECQFCYKSYKFKRSLNCHILHHHNRNGSKSYKFKCHLCKRSFQTRSGLVFHVRIHDKNNKFQCPVCPHTEFRENNFIAHVMLHENATCYPCQVCAQVFKTAAERLEHWHTHAGEKPHACNICYRRFRRSNILRNHLKLHCIYECQFCGDNFKTTQTLRQPYVCVKCEQLPHIKKTVEHQRSLASNKRVFDSDEEE